MIIAKDSPFHPKHWPFWIGIGILRLLALIPFSVQMLMGRHLGKLIRRHNKKIARITETNIDLCFPSLTANEKETFLKKNFESLGMSFFEMLDSAWPSFKNLDKRLKNLTGAEHITDTLQAGHGVILLFPHLMGMYYAGYLLLQKIKQPWGLMYHRPRNPALGYFMDSKLTYHCEKVFTRKNLREMVSYLQKPGVVWYSPDLDLGRKNSVFAPFFNIPAATLTVTSKIAQMTHAKVLPIGFYRSEDSKSYDVHIHAPLENFPSGDDLEDATRLNAVVESLILPHPEQYLWQYKRFQTRPEGEEKIYKKK